MKKIIALFLVTVMLLSAVACGGSASKTEGNETGKVEIQGNSNAFNAGTEKQSEPKATDAPVPAEQKKKGGVLKMVGGTPTTRAWYDIRGIMAIAQMAYIYETLCRYDSTGTPEMFLAESVTPDSNAKTWTIKVKDNIYFTDGSKLTAEVVKWNLDYYKEKGVLSASYFKYYESCEVVDELTCVCHFTEWDSLFDYSLCRTVLIASKKAFDDHGEEWLVENPVGTGPFKQKEFNADVSWIFERNDNYWQGEVLLDGIESITYQQALVAAQALNAGEVQIQLTEDYNLVEQMRNFSGLHAKASDLPSYYYTLCFNMRPSEDGTPDPFEDVRVRQAVSYLVDVDQIMSTLTFGYALKTNQWAPPGSQFYNDQVQGQEHNVEKAKELLKEAGYENGFKTQITTSNNTVIVQIAQIIIEELKEVGIECELNQVEGAAWVNYIGDWDKGMFIHQMGAEAGAASQYSTTFYNYEGFGLGVGSFLVPDELDKVTTSITSAPTEEARAEATRQVAKMVVDDLCMMKVLFGSQAIVFMRDEVKDCHYGDVQNLRADFWQTWLDK